jgi:hypothetical protein
VQIHNNTYVIKCEHNYWIDQVCPLNTGDEIWEYTSLWEEIHLFSRNPKAEDEITW